jgi:hypothetical protein
MVNDCCHNFTGQVPANGGHIMRSPKVVPILWGRHYINNPGYATQIKNLISDLVTGPFMNGLSQYGVRRGTVINPIIIDTNPDNEPKNLTRNQMSDQLIKWINNNDVQPAPAIGERNLLYIIFLPTSSTTSSSDGGLEYGYHTSKKFNASSTVDNLFWATILTNPDPSIRASDTTSDMAFARSLAYIVSHEFNEAFTDRDFNGFNLNVTCSDNAGTTRTDNCEIGDICEQINQPRCCTTFNYKGWMIEWYWSNWHNSCIQGNSPVSIKKFLNVIDIDGSRGLRQLNTNKINIDFIADKIAGHFGLGN